MDIRFLESFVVVVECGSVAQAARRLNLTPAALAQRMQALSHELGHPLVSRVGRTVRPTAAGIAILPQVKALIEQARDLRLAVSADDPSGQIRVGATASAMTGLIPDILAKMRSEFPKVDFYMRPGSSADLYQALLARDLDAALLIHPQFELSKSLGWQTLREEKLLLVAPCGTDLSDPHGAITRYPFIRYDRDQWGGQIVDKYLVENGLRVQEWLELDALDAIVTLVDRGMGVAIIPDWAPPWPAGLHLERAVLGAGGIRRTGVMWNLSSATSAGVKAFVDCALVSRAGATEAKKYS